MMESPKESIDESLASRQVEARRRAYLRALGIDRWVPQSVTPVEDAAAIALPSLDRESDNATVKSTATAVAPQSSVTSRALLSPNASSSASSSAALLSDAPAHSSRPEAVNLEPVAEPNLSSAKGSDKESEEGVPRFTLVLQSFTDSAIIIADTQLPDVPGLSAEEHVLLHRIKSALRNAHPNASYTDQELGIFSWPMVDNVAIDQGLGAAKDALRGMLDAQTRLGMKHVLVFGDTLRELLQHQDGQQTATVVGQLRLEFTHSLHTIIQQPSLKKSIWAQLQQWARSLDE